MQALPSHPFQLDTRARKEESEIDFLYNWLESNGLQKYKEWLNQLSYMQLFSTDDEIWNAIERIVEGNAGAPYPASRRTDPDANAVEDEPEQPNQQPRGKKGWEKNLLQ